MKRSVIGIAHFVLLAAAVLAQSASDSPAGVPAAGAIPAFVIADVHASPHRNGFVPSGRVMLRGDRYILRHSSMRDLVAIAYGVNAGYVTGGPKWLESEQFDIDAKMPPKTTPDAAKLMLRNLLEDRFKLVARETTALAPANGLTADKDKLKIKQSDGSGDAGCQFKPPAPAQPAGAIIYMQISCRNISMAAFVQSLHAFTYDYEPGPIMDFTGLKGTWDFDLKWSNRSQLAMSGADGISLYDALEKQLGLKLEKKMAPRPVIMVDSVNETPTPNSPDLAKLLPPLPPPEIEVATIKPSQPNERGMFRINGLELNLQNMPLKNLIDFAWDLDFGDDEELANAPKWVDSERFDIVAKMAIDTQGSTDQGRPFIDIDDIRRMLRELLVERFEIKSHTEDRPITAFAMMATNPKLKEADPASHTRCGNVLPVGEKDPRLANPALDQLVVCQNMTMAQIADKFQQLAPGYIYGNVRDATGIKGSWDFTLSFSSAWVVGSRGGGMMPASDSAQTASDPNGAIPFFDAVNKQLGLKLVKEKRSLPVLVIDHIDEKPTEN